MNMDNNVVECYNTVLAKFTGSKRINFSSRLLHQTGCETALFVTPNIESGQISGYIRK